MKREVNSALSPAGDTRHRRAALHNLGCKVNAYETEAMQQLLEEAGYEIVPFSEEADVYIVNTCSVTNVADKKSRQMLHRAKKLNPHSIVVAAGCYVQTSKEAAESDAAVDILIGNNRKCDLIRILEEYERGHAVSDAFADISRTAQEYEELRVSSPAEHTRAFLKVQDGCNQFCSYCIIPYARGRVRSRTIADVMCEASQLAANGYREIVLTGIHLSSFGMDHGEDLRGLICSLHEINGIDRIRLGSLEPGIITEEFAAALAALPKVCPHFHLSLQSGSDTVLTRMNRRYNTAEYAEKCEILRRHFTHPALTTDIIVGFPGETEAEFEETLAFAEQIRFYEIHVFKYSKRAGTRAADMQGQIPEQVKAARSRRLMAAAEEMKREFIRWYRGKEVAVLFERRTGSLPHEDSDPEMGAGGRPADSGENISLYEGFTPEYVKVIYPSGQNLENQIKMVEFSEYLY